MTLDEAQFRGRRDRVLGWLLRYLSWDLGLIFIVTTLIKAVYEWSRLNNQDPFASVVANLANLFQTIPTIPFWLNLFPDPDVRSYLNASNLRCALVFFFFAGLVQIGIAVNLEGKEFSRRVREEKWNQTVGQPLPAKAAEISVRVLPQQDRWYIRPTGMTGLSTLAGVLASLIAALILRQC